MSRYTSNSTHYPSSLPLSNLIRSYDPPESSPNDFLNMTSEASSTPVSLTRYRPALYVLTGVTAAYAIFYLHNHLTTRSSHQPPLRRRGAIHRQGPRRRGAVSSSTDESQLRGSPIIAISHLEELERENGSYGTFQIEVDDGRRVESRLIPAQLATIEQLQRDVGLTLEHAERVRRLVEDAFLDSFLALELIPSHVIQRGSGEWDYLRAEFMNRGIGDASIEAAFTRFNSDSNFGSEHRRRPQNDEVDVARRDGAGEPSAEAPPAEGGGDATADEQSVFSWRDGANDSSPTREGQNLLNLLYHIAEDQAKRDGYIHRGVTCNSCGAMPIQGIRYRCSNCIDYDLCETCEAMQVHIKTHLFYKIRIPAPFLGNPRQSQPVWYPGKPVMLPRSLPRNLAKRLMRETNFENTDLDALWDQFRCLANVEWVNDPNKLNMAIDRKTFDRCFVPNTSSRPPAPSLIYDRMFAFYDTNGDNLIGFEEFLKGLASFNNKSLHERLRRIFDGYDIDRDGYVERKDFLRVFRAYYTLSRELTRDMVAGMEDDFLDGGAREIVLGSQPISSAFPGNIPPGEPSRIGEGKRTNLQGDQEIIDDQGVLRPDGDDRGDRNEIVADAEVRERLGTHAPPYPQTVRMNGVVQPRPETTYTDDSSSYVDHHETDDDSDGSDDERIEDGPHSLRSTEQWPPSETVTEGDIVNALGAYVPLHEVTDRVDRARIRAALYRRIHDEENERIESLRREGIEERWERRRFYIDEEDGTTAPPGYNEDQDSDLSDGKDDLVVNDSHPPSPRSRSSSKVRFQDDVTDNEYETRSNQSTSSRSIPVGERWGGFEVPQVEKDVGKEILYQVTQQGLNELLDLIFKPKEDLLMEAYHTRAERKRWAKEIEAFESNPIAHMYPSRNEQTGGDTTESMPSTEAEDIHPRDKPLTQLLQEAGYTTESGLMAEAEAYEEIFVPQDGSANSGTGSIANSNNIPSSPLPDPTLPQNRPNEALEPFPPAITTHEHEHPHHSPLLEPTPTSTPPSPALDPTLPQNRPNTPDISHPQDPPQLDPEIARPSSSLSSTTSISTSYPNQSLPLRLRFQPTSSSSSHPHPHDSNPNPTQTTHNHHHHQTPPPPNNRPPPPSAPPSPKTLARWTRLNAIEREARERAGNPAGSSAGNWVGPAKLNFEEFGERMRGDRGRRLGFVGSWVEMASF
ncbi:hypothetical protein FQN54_003794 [Arachnomyces sp. PD_36]|nr:hypothetical protein FQN54_003794 [Arachnomyces sp. PD_36]